MYVYVCACDHLCPLSLFTSSWRFLTNLPTTLTATPPPWPNREPVQTVKGNTIKCKQPQSIRLILFPVCLLFHITTILKLVCYTVLKLKTTLLLAHHIQKTGVSTQT